MSKMFNVKFTINFTNLTGFAILIYSLYNNFNGVGITAGTTLMLGRKCSCFNN